MQNENEMTAEQKEAYAREVVADFAQALWEDRARQLSQMMPGADVNFLLMEKGIKVPFREDWLSRGMEPQEWLAMARAGLGLTPDAEKGYIYEICQSLAEWLFAVPGSYSYEIPASWYETPMGALWAAALVWAWGDELITIKKAADMAGVTTQAISGMISRGRLQAYVNPAAPQQQGRRLVRSSDVEALYGKKEEQDAGDAE